MILNVPVVRTKSHQWQPCLNASTAAMKLISILPPTQKDSRDSPCSGLHIYHWRIDPWKWFPPDTVYQRSIWVTVNNPASERIMTLFNVNWVGCSTSICFEITLCWRIINAVLINRITMTRAMLMLGFDQRVDVCAIKSRYMMVIEVWHVICPGATRIRGLIHMLKDPCLICKPSPAVRTEWKSLGWMKPLHLQWHH